MGALSDFSIYMLLNSSIVTGMSYSKTGVGYVHSVARKKPCDCIWYKYSSAINFAQQTSSLYFGEKAQWACAYLVSFKPTESQVSLPLVMSEIFYHNWDLSKWRIFAYTFGQKDTCLHGTYQHKYICPFLWLSASNLQPCDSPFGGYG